MRRILASHSLGMWLSVSLALQMEGNVMASKHRNHALLFFVRL
ncbi:hypothetical protein GcM3_c17038o4 [Golovinomyces cichoracearum]|uniref:Uncharacterized protein n=1 Tax=Golovinomyces cichoracearum TaxID=62708 RepID=A0A420IY36_9PEZI|nr:hypothetical protein GcM3_c17038o4 [Golovinomyces cichoracearum]